MISVVTEGAAIDGIWDEILRPNFPDAELVERAAFRQGVADGMFEVLAWLDGTEPVGAIVGEQHGGTVLVSWLAVGARGRGGGVGGALLRAGVGRWLARPGVTLVLAEVERPDMFAAHPVYGDPRRRLAFYARTAPGVVDLPYYQPALAPGLPRVHGLLLTVVGTTESAPAPRALSTDESAAVRSYLQAVLHDDPAGAAVLTAAARPLRLLPLDDYTRVQRSDRLSPRW